MAIKKKAEPSIRVSLKEIIEGFFGIRREETPSYIVLHKEGPYEIREYAGYICAQVEVKGGDEKNLVRTAFMRLARYIFGANKKQTILPMAAPVIKEALSETITMTAPVLMQSSDNNALLRMSFIMPKNYHLDELPKPDDTSITFKVVEKHRAATLTYSGRSNIQKEETHIRELREWIKKQKDYREAHDPIFAGYDPPWTISFRRKNEIIIPLKP